MPGEPENGWRHRLDLTGLPDAIAAELAWMAHWQAQDGTRSSVLALNQLANILRRAIRERPSVPGVDARDGLADRRPRCRAGSTPPGGVGCRRRVAALGCGPYSASPAWRCWPAATTARGGSWTTGTRGATRVSRCRRANRMANYGCSPGQLPVPWLRAAAKWHLGTDAGVRHAALDHGQPGAAAVPAPLRQLADHLPRRSPPGAGRPGRRRGSRRPRSRRWAADPRNRMRATATSDTSANRCTPA